MQKYKLLVNDRNYSSWEIYDADKFNKIQNVDIKPVECKLFSNDIFYLNNNNSITILHSSIRSGSPMPGVLVIAGNKTYGRQNNLDGKHIAKKNGKLLYKCIPDDMRIPSFLVPYEIKHIGFSKMIKNLYVTFTFDEWDTKHPLGKLNNVIGPVDILDNFYEYQLYCKSLNASIQKFQKDTSKALENKSHEGVINTLKNKYPNIEDRTNQKLWHIFTIDPLNSQDFDDAFSIIDNDDGVKQLSIYISNVTLWIDSLNLWDSFSRRISTIYLPDKKRPMLPTILSDCLCSLQENVTRIALVMDIFIKDNDIINITYKNCFIKVIKNYIYEENKLLGDYKYLQLFDTTKSLSKNFKYINNIRNSHDVVCYLMIFMNFHCANELIKTKSGIFRSTIMKREMILPDTIPEEVSQFIKIWSSASGQYIDGATITDTRHELLDMDAYIHITSPIRRLVDLLNMIKFQQTSGIHTFSENVDKFYSKWIGDIDYINITMRSIRKVQCDCNLLDLCHTNLQVMDKEYDGYLFDKISRNDGLYQFIVYLPEIKLSSRVTMREDCNNFDCKKFKLFLFNDEERFKKKIRLHLL
jgi:exoribonuclease R